MKVFWNDVTALIMGLHRPTGVKVQRTVKQTEKSILLYDNFKNKEKKGKNGAEAHFHISYMKIIKSHAVNIISQNTKF